MAHYAELFVGGAIRWGEQWGVPILAGLGLACGAIYVVMAEVRRPTS
jgi:hypothetical protein